MVTSLPSHYFRLSLSLSLTPIVPHAQYRTGQDLIIRLWFSITRRAARAIWKRGNKDWKRAKNFLAMESVNSLRISAPPWWPLREGRDGKCEGRNEKCEFLARESVSSSPILARYWWRHFRLCLSVSLSLSLSPKVPHAQYRKRFRASYNNKKVSFEPCGKLFLACHVVVAMEWQTLIG